MNESIGGENYDQAFEADMARASKRLKSISMYNHGKINSDHEMLTDDSQNKSNNLCDSDDSVQSVKA